MGNGIFHLGSGSPIVIVISILARISESCTFLTAARVRAGLVLAATWMKSVTGGIAASKAET